MKKSDLSIIIPVYNGQDYILRCLDSIMRQQDSDQHEIIVVNDGSTDDTPKILGAAAEVYKNVHIINQANAGVSSARNLGLGASHGEYVTFVDCDDMVGLNIDAFDKYFVNLSSQSTIGNMDIRTVHGAVPNLRPAHFDDKYFMNMLHAAYETDADVVLGGKLTINRDDMYMRRHVYTTDQVYGVAPADKHTILCQAEIRENANFALYRRKMLDSWGLRFLVNMKLDEDILFCMLATLYADRVATTKDVTYFYNRHQNTLSNIQDQNEMIKKYKVADIRRFSVLLHEIGKRPEYSEIFTYWLKQYARKGAKHVFDFKSGEFPPSDCYYWCDQKECTGCFIADAMRESFIDNIQNYLTNQK